MKFYYVILCLLTAHTMTAQRAEDPLYQKARALAQEYIIVDGHVDLPYRLQTRHFRLEREYLGIPIESKTGDFDYVRAKAGGLDAPFMSIYIPSDRQEEARGGAQKLAEQLIDMIEGIIAAHPDKFAPGRSPDQIEANFSKGLISLPLGLENGAPVLTMEDLKHYYDRGIRYITLTHAKNNHICDSSYDKVRKWNGLSPFGRQVVQEMNRLGIMIDVSHISDETFYQVMDITSAPVIASHSSCRKFTPGWERNMDDAMIRRLAENGGVIMINFGSAFLDDEVRRFYDRSRQQLADLLEEKGLSRDDEEAKPVIEEFRKNNPRLYADVKTVANHIDHVVALTGIDYVGLGSDYDGVGDSLPTGLKDVSDYPNLIYELLKRGYSDDDIAKICFGNIFRVWRAVESIASDL